MGEHAQELLATRTVAVRLPNGETQYWLTDQVFEVGDKLRRSGRVWEVAEVLPPGRDGSYLTVRLAEGER